MNKYLRVGLVRIPLHAIAFGGATAVTSYVMWAKGLHHWLLIPSVLGVIAAFGKELWEQIPKASGLPGAVGQVWGEFWEDALAQSVGALVGVGTNWIQAYFR